MTNAQVISPPLNVIRSDLKAPEPVAKSSQAALQQITAAKQRQTRQNHHSSCSLHLPSLHYGPGLAKESQTSPTASTHSHQLTSVCPHHLISKTNGTRSHGCRAGMGPGRVIWIPEGAWVGMWVGAWVCRWCGDKQMCGVGRIGKQAATCFSQGLLQLLRGIPRGAHDLAEPCSTQPRLKKLQGNPLWWAGAPQPRKTPCSFSLYWENQCQSSSCPAVPSWDRGVSPAGEKTQKTHEEPHILEETSPRAALAAFLSPLSLLCRGHQAGHWSPEEWWWDLSHPGLTAASPYPGGFAPRRKASTRPR